jgi:hypothetical protein
MNIELFNLAVTGRTGIVALVLLAVLVVLIIQNPAILSWLLAALYTGPR